ncbi:MAG: helix-turn-helix domain-containing protein [Alphaproteobacteria bacterium]|nr:helix-turn-helix domain-containing protein [Alphaproteobacteria bacterium]
MPEKELLRELGAYITKVRRDRKISQQQLADLSGKMLNTISNIERGLTDPRAGTLVAIARALSIPAQELITPYHNTIIKENNSAVFMETVKFLHSLSDDELRKINRALHAFIEG